MKNWQSDDLDRDLDFTLITEATDRACELLDSDDLDLDLDFLRNSELIFRLLDFSGELESLYILQSDDSDSDCDL